MISRQASGKQEKSVAVDRQVSTVDRPVQPVNSKKSPVDSPASQPETWFWKPRMLQYLSIARGHLLTAAIKLSHELGTIVHRMNAKWELISGRLPNRTAEEVEKYWTMKERKKFMQTKLFKPT
ncbi:hypothetical protein Taro_043429 [Colocasia esculenta]|uniref:Uncharacterized protein n=1 Tax=Colocasia esculenta TaxID=4460 RepID=A0A843WVS2_COLES|nr:hypothetical protein [Colocasia esculenta]